MLGRLAAAMEGIGEAALRVGAVGIQSAGPRVAGRVLVQSQPSLSLQQLVCVDRGQGPAPSLSCWSLGKLSLHPAPITSAAWDPEEASLWRMGKLLDGMRDTGQQGR